MKLFDNSDEIFEAIEFIAYDGSTTQKQMYLSEFLQDSEFRRVVELSLHPLVSYGMLQVPSAPVGDGHFDHIIWNVLEALSERQLTGHAAHDAVQFEMERLTADSQELLKRIITKDLRAGFGIATVNKAAKKSEISKGIIPEFPYMRCSLPKHVKLNEWPWSKGIDSQVKMDGVFANLTVSSSMSPKLTTRKGFTFEMEGSAWEYINREINLLPKNTRYSGELCIMRNGQVMKRKVGNGLINKLLQGKNEIPGDCSICYTVWDSIPLDSVADGVYRVKQSERKLKLQAELAFLGLFAISFVESHLVFSYEEAKAHAEEVIEAGGEGTIFKHPEGIWKKGTSKHEVKLKAEHTADLRMLALTPGKGKNIGTFGAVKCATDDGIVLVDVSGFSDELRQDIWDNWGTVYQDRLMEVTFNELINAKNKETFSLFLPRFHDMRFDKSETDTYESIKAMA